MQRKRTALNLALLAAIVVAATPNTAHAYIGPGAGIALGTTLFAFFAAFFSGLVAFFLWPLRWLIRFVRGRHALAKARIKRFVVLGLDGMEPTLAEKFMAEGKMPNLSRLAKEGTFKRLATTLPPLSPVAWSTFLTGCNPGKHNIFDFLTRDKHNYLPLLSSVQIAGPSRELKIGRYRIPLGKPRVRLLRRGKPFWNILGEHGIFGDIIRVPITFPPEPFRGVLLSAMCVPDLRGTQGTFTYYTTRADETEEHISGETVVFDRDEDVVRASLIGPENTIRDGAGTMHCPFEVKLTGEDSATLSICGETHALKVGKYTPWVRVTFKAGLGIKVRGICECLLISTEPEIRLYVTPIQVDPDSPALPISHPGEFATYLSKSQGSYATLGLAEDTWAMNAKILGDDEFLHQCNEADEEREQMFFDALDKVRRGLVVCVFDGTDRIQHMFWRYIDPDHPAHAGQADKQHRGAIEELYMRMDELVGRTRAKCDDDGTVLMVISDHGFNPFRRGLDLNYWLQKNGYLKLKPDAKGAKYLADVDWSQTKAFCLGLAGIWLNVKGREAQGIVEPEEADALRDELAEKLTGLRDDEKNELAISRAFNAHKTYRGPYRVESPDIIVGYNRGYRVSWEAAIGEPTGKLFHDNTRAWSGDHCIDPKLVPGVLFCNRKIETANPRLMDISATALDLFGVPIPPNMDARPLTVADADGTYPNNGSNGKSSASPTPAPPIKDAATA